MYNLVLVPGSRFANFKMDDNGGEENITNLLWLHGRFFVQLLFPTNFRMSNKRYIFTDLFISPLKFSKPL